MPAHDMLVSECQKSAANVMARLAVVPMVQVACQQLSHGASKSITFFTASNACKFQIALI